MSRKRRKWIEDGSLQLHFAMLVLSVFIDRHKGTVASIGIIGTVICLFFALYQPVQVLEKKPIISKPKPTAKPRPSLPTPETKSFSAKTWPILQYDKKLK